VAHSEILLVWGAGGHGRVVADVIGSAGGRVAGFADAKPRAVENAINGERWRCVDEVVLIGAVEAAGALPLDAEAVALGIGDNNQRSAARMALGVKVARALIHPTSVVSQAACVAPGTVVLAGAIINAGSRVGAGSIVNTGAVVDHDCILGEDVHVATGAVLTGGISLGDRVLVGAGAVLLPGVGVGDDAVIGAGAVVIRDVPRGATVVGNPARILDARDRDGK
jgi:sugar O-acyltransferase (sialic acid O-acetyltransferase NeuD family)